MLIYIKILFIEIMKKFKKKYNLLYIKIILKNIKIV